MDRREVLRWLPTGAAVGWSQLWGPSATGAPAAEAGKPASPRGLPPLKITDISTILTAPNRVRLVIVKVSTSEPGLYGLGLRHVHPARLRGADGRREVPQAVPGRPQRRRDRGHLAVVLRQLVLAERPGAVQRDERRRHGALGHQGQARRHAGLSAPGGQVPVRRRPLPARPRARLQGGRGRRPPGDREGLPARPRPGRHPGPGDLRHLARPVGARGAGGRSGRPTRRTSGSPAPTCGPSPSCSSTSAPTVGDEVELLHDVHERISPSQAIKLCKELEKYRLFFLEDPLSPEDKDHFRPLRQQTSTPIAMGELFNTQQEYVPLIAGRLIDFIRIHISQIGGLSMARKVAALCEFFGVRTAWHGPGDCSPVGARRGAGPGAGLAQLRHPRGLRLPRRDARGLPRLPRGQGRLPLRQRGPGPGDRHRREAGRAVPLPRRERRSTTAGARLDAATAR